MRGRKLMKYSRS